jgi:hypothetical protein
MALPDINDLHISRLLTGISVAYFQDEANFVAQRAFQPVPVPNKTDIYLTYDKGPWFKTEAKELVPYEESPGIGWTTGTAAYNARVWGVHADISEEELANADQAFQLERNKTRLVVNDLKLQQEKRWVTSFFKTGVWTGLPDQAGVAGTATLSANQFHQWDNGIGTANPIVDIQTAALTIAKKTGVKPNVLVVGPEVELQLLNSPIFIERIKYSQPGFPSRQLLASAFGVDEVLVPYVTENTTPAGTAATMAFTYGKSALLLYRPPGPGLEVPASGYTFTWSGLLGANALNGRIRRYPIEQKRIVNRIEGETAYDMQAVAPDTAAFFASVVP